MYVPNTRAKSDTDSYSANSCQADGNILLLFHEAVLEIDVDVLMLF